MSERREYNFYLELPYEVIEGMEQVDLPSNMHNQYEKYLESIMDDVDSDNIKWLKMCERYSANYILIGEIIHVMVEKDLTFKEAYDNLRGSISEMLQQLDEIFSELFEEEEAMKIFKQLFQNLLKMAKKRDSNKIKESENKAFISLRDVDDKIVRSLENYGVDYLAAEILADEEVTNYIEREYVNPIQGILKEYLTLYMEEYEEEYVDIFKAIFIQSKEFIAYQVLLNLIIVDAINKELRVSETIREVDREKLVSDGKKMILSSEGFNEYREEFEEVMKLLLEGQTQ